MAAIFCLQSNTAVARNVVVAFAKKSPPGQPKNIERVDLPEKVKNSRVLILGSTGRVGGSTATALSKFCPEPPTFASS